MKPAPFDYVRIDSGDELAQLLAQAGSEGRILAGGQSLMAMLNIRLAQPQVLFDISRCAELNYARIENGMLCVGAAATQASIEWRPELAKEVPLLKQVFPWISHFQIRNRGTVCGSIAHADPSAELPLALTALNGSVVLRSAKGRRSLPASEFFQGMLMTAIAPGEFVEEVRFPLARAGHRHAFREVAMRHGDFALVALAASVTPEGMELTAGGVADRPVKVQWKAQPGDSGFDLDSALNDFAWSLQAQSDTHASASYRRHLVRQLGRQLFSELAA
jgi:2-furoyl-CoA dehydrogenase FAD binding subunit